MTPIEAISKINRALAACELKGYSASYSGTDYTIEAAIPGTASTIELARYDTVDDAIEAVECMRSSPWKLLPIRARDV